MVTIYLYLLTALMELSFCLEIYHTQNNERPTVGKLDSFFPYSTLIHTRGYTLVWDSPVNKIIKVLLKTNNCTAIFTHENYISEAKILFF